MRDLFTSPKFWEELFIMTFGMLLVAIAVHFFLVPSKLIIGNLAGLSIVFYILTDIPVSILTFMLNGVLLIISYLLIGKEFGAKTIYSALILSPWLFLLETYFPTEKSIMGDPWFDLICFVFLISIAQSYLFRINASTGGIDIIAKILNVYAHLDMGAGIIWSGLVVCATGFFVNDIRMVIISVIATYINGTAVNYFTAGLNRKKRVNIISKDHVKLQNYIIKNLVRGVTLYDVTGGYSGEKKVEIKVLLTLSEFSSLMKFIEKEQIDAFITASNVSEVYGYWIKNKRAIRIDTH